MGQLSHLNSWPQLVYPFPRCQCGPHSAWSLQLLADTPISQTSHSCTSRSSCWLITRPFGLRERSGGWRRMGTKCQLLDLPNFCLHWLKHADMGDIQQEKKKREKSLKTDQKRWGNETLADAALTWQMGNEIVGSFRCVPSICSPIHPSSDLSSSSRKRVGNASHLKLLGQLSQDITLHPRRLRLVCRAWTWQKGWPLFVSMLHTV